MIRGVVRARFETRLVLLADALIEARSEGRVRTVRSDSGGRYVLTGLPAGPAMLRVTQVGHESLELTVRVPTTGVVELDLELTAAPLSLPGVRVEASAEASRPDDLGGEAPLPVPDPRFELRQLELSPGVVESGLIDAVAGMPGNDPANPSDVLFMRGSTTDMKLVLLDGVPVYAPFHVGGLLSSFEPSMLASADFHVGGAPARYDGGLTHVLDLQTRTARRDRTRASATVDLLSTAVVLEQPLGSRAGALVSARALHGAGSRVLGGGSSPYGYADALGIVDADLGSAGRVRVTGFRNRESVLLDYVGAPEKAGWGNGALTSTWSGRIRSADVQMTGRYQSVRRPASASAGPNRGRSQSVGDSRGGQQSASACGARVVLAVVGVCLYAQGLRSRTRRSRIPRPRFDGSSRLLRVGGRSVLGAYVDGSRTLRDGVTFRAGLRGDVFGGDAPRFAPRASIALEVGPTSLLTVAAGRYHQITRMPLDGGVDQTLEHFADGGLAEVLPVASADHVVLTLAQRPTESVSLGLNGYFKRFTGLEAGGGALQNSGVDVQVVGASERGAAWLGYGLSWFWLDAAAGGSTGEFTGRHLLTMGLSGRLAGPVQIETRFSYGAGLPSTGIPFSSSGDQLSAEGPSGPGLETLSGDSGGRVTVRHSFSTKRSSGST